LVTRIREEKDGEMGNVVFTVQLPKTLQRTPETMVNVIRGRDGKKKNPRLMLLLFKELRV
jgi:hypothetical protein